ncbi:uncharacterized protein TRIADDRAFT_52412 [Trichoplax adhaerens]|uniref:Uncharacterized protein n=1 Tax=Trichoplax adhaerens TaxID=10228 RepID=B3RIB2_TRIAD|nr:hypothetical protein TRIADDRAFT_52412 [Trichoplax adhaerens]EDV29721.1 hypothetical protein TRIADDRAFT_52412 [Trichoplax adhaerens]|eukprot:XP_002108923.1 hypothetical protein TRIADDRAFT_52412 [Trichoplax adhaerens]
MSLYDGVGGIDTTVSPFAVVNSVPDEGSTEKRSNNGSGPEIANWSSNYKLLQTQIQRRKIAESSKQMQKPKSGTTMPIIHSNKYPPQVLNLVLKHFIVLLSQECVMALDAVRENATTAGFNPLSRAPAEHTIDFAVNHGDEPFEETEASLADIRHEYEPLRPNDYDQALELRRKQEKLEDKHVRIADSVEKQETSNSERRVGAAIAPPSSLTACIEKPELHLRLWQSTVGKKAKIKMRYVEIDNLN